MRDYLLGVENTEVSTRIDSIRHEFSRTVYTNKSPHSSMLIVQAEVDFFLEELCVLCGNLSSQAKAGPIDAELSHSSSQGVRVDLEYYGCSIRPLNATVCGCKNRLDVLFCHCIQRDNSCGGLYFYWFL